LRRAVQVGVDATFAAAAVFFAYELRFDGAVPDDLRGTRYGLMLLAALVQPAIMAAGGIYRSTWRFFAFDDAVRFGAGDALATAVLLALHSIIGQMHAVASPTSVILIQAPVFLLLASGARGVRRLIAEKLATASGERKRLVLVGSASGLATALRQTAGSGNLEIVGCVVPGCNEHLRGVQIAGYPILGDIGHLNNVLQAKLKPELVLVADATLDCIGDVVSIATQHATEVRLLPSAANVMHGDVSVSTTRRASQRVERVLVVGGGGYLGSVLVPMLLGRGYKVRVLDRLLFGGEPLAGFANHKNFELQVGDVRDLQAVVGAMKQCDAVIDLAAIVGDPACAVNKRLSLEVNRAATRVLIDISKGCGVGRLLFASTCSVYGASDYLVDELTAPAPISIYAETKVASEQLLLEAAGSDFHPVILRLGTLFGLSARRRFDLVVNLLAARAAATGKITIFNGEQWRPFLHVYDAARAFVAALEAPAEELSGEIFNVGDYHLNLRLSEVSSKIAAIVPSVVIEHVENGDRRNYRASFDKIHSRLAFRCERTVEFGIREIYSAIVSGQIADFTASQFNNHVMTKLFSEWDNVEQCTVRMIAELAA
jgi:nucleoside-diphosphate-sugar epimerase